MKSLGYVLTEFVNGTLPWTGTSSCSDGTLRNIILLGCKQKLGMDLCEGICQDYPDVLKTYFGYLQRNADLQPNYQYLKVMFRLGEPQGFDWESIPVFIQDLQEEGLWGNLYYLVADLDDDAWDTPCASRKSEPLGRGSSTFAALQRSFSAGFLPDPEWEGPLGEDLQDMQDFVDYMLPTMLRPVRLHDS